MLPGHIASTYKLPQKQIAKLDATSLFGCKESLQLLLQLLGCIANNGHSQLYSQHCTSRLNAIAADVTVQPRLSFCNIVSSLAGCRTACAETYRHASRTYHGSPKMPLLLCAFWHLPLVFQPLASQLLHISASILLPESTSSVEPHVCTVIICSIQGGHTHDN